MKTKSTISINGQSARQRGHGILRKAAWIAAITLAGGLLGLRAQTFTGEGNWQDDARWDTGLPGDGATVEINGVCEITENIGPQNTWNPAGIRIGVGTEGTLNVLGGTLSGAHGGGAAGGIYVGVGAGGVGTLYIADGAAFRSQGGTMRVKIGDEDGGQGTVIVAGELLNYKFFEIVNGTLEMRPTGINNKFNDGNNRNTIGPNGTLSFVIDGPNVGTMERANTSGLKVDVDPSAHLRITLNGDFKVGDSWTLMRYTELVGQFAEGFSFTNQQGYTFDIDYGATFDSELRVTLTSTAARPSINSFTAAPPAIAAGGSTTLQWTVGGFDSVSIDQGVGDVTGLTTGGAGQVVVNPTGTTTYTLTLIKGGVEVTDTVTVVVEEAPIIRRLAASVDLIAPGDSTTLSWKVDGADTIDLTDLGSVGPVGEQTLSPGATTTYVLTAQNAYGSATAEVTVVVDGILVSLVDRYDAAAPGNNDGFWKDSVGVNNFDLKSNELITDLVTYRTDFTAANHMVSFSNDTGGDGLAFPGGSSTYELWVRPGELGDGHQVIFETGGADDGRCILMTRDAVRFLNSEGGTRTHDFTVPLTDIDISDFVQIVAVVDENAQEATLYVKGSAGGAASATSVGSVGTPNGRSTLFSWSSFAAGIAGALGGSANEEPAGTTQFRGEIALFNVFGRTLSADEVQTQFDRHVIPDPGLIASFTATPDRVASGGTVTLAWQVGAFDSLEVLGEGDVAGNTAEGAGSLEVTPTESREYVLVASNAEGSSVARVTVLVDVPAGAILLSRNADSWDLPDVWSDGQPAHAGADYIVTDFLAERVGTPVDFSPTFPGTSLELRGPASQLVLQQEFGTTAQINDLRLNGGAVVAGAAGGTLGLGGAVNALGDSFFQVVGPATTLQLDAPLSGPGSLTFNLGNADSAANELWLGGDNSGFTGGLVLNGGKTQAFDASGLGAGDLTLINGDLLVFSDWNSPDTTLALQGNRALFEVDFNVTVGALNLILGSGINRVVPPGAYDVTSWQAFLDANPDLGGPYFNFLGFATVTVLGEDPRPIAGTTFTGAGNWMEPARWTEGVPGDGDLAVVNGDAVIDDDIAPSNTTNPGSIFIGDHTAGSLEVIGGALSGAYGGSGIYVGIGQGGEGHVTIAEGASLRTQGGGMRLQIGDQDGGTGTVSVAGELLNYKWFWIIDGSLEMLPTGLNRSFNSTDVSRIEAGGTLAFVIDGDQVGTIQRANDTGLVLEIDPAATLKVTLQGNVTEGQTWTLIDYSTLTGQFAQGTAFTNEQGHQFEVEYGTGDHDVVTLRLVTLNPDAQPPTLQVGRDGSAVRIEFTGTLEGAEAVTGPWTPVAGAVSPYNVEPTAPFQFYRAVK